MYLIFQQNHDIEVRLSNIMVKQKTFRFWFYFRQGWGIYFAFIFAAINTMVTTYYLAIKNIPILLDIFPSFIHYSLTIGSIGIPLLIFVGWLHFRRSQAFSSEMDILFASNPYMFRAQPGWQMEVIFPLYLAMSKILVKISNGDKLSDDEIRNLNSIQEKVEVLLKGGHVGSTAPTSLDKNIQ